MGTNTNSLLAQMKVKEQPEQVIESKKRAKVETKQEDHHNKPHFTVVQLRPKELQKQSDIVRSFSMHINEIDFYEIS